MFKHYTLYIQENTVLRDEVDSFFTDDRYDSHDQSGNRVPLCLAIVFHKEVERKWMKCAA